MAIFCLLAIILLISHDSRQLVHCLELLMLTVHACVSSCIILITYNIIRYSYADCDMQHMYGIQESHAVRVHVINFAIGSCWQ